ncbi:MAG: hypothetical protein JNJ71_16125 [Rubrivivax sp.]|nr:hypothetical protein [Rubrivivax sp.]
MAALLGWAGLLCACSPAPQQTLFPLEGGQRWTYDVRIEWENNTVEHETRELSTEGRATVGDAPAWVRRSADGVEWFLRSDDSGIYRVATRTDLDAEPQADAMKRYVLKLPLAVGTNWQHPTTAYLLRRRQEFPPEIRHTHPSVPMSYSIEAVDEAVQTRIGRFERCVRVRGRAVLRLFADPVVGWRDMPLTTTEWYCPGPGLVRLTREEPAQSTFLVGGTLTMDLMTWN